eukprot:scaffold260768_cov18-Tisochrysis_lutea.AAC.1
MTTATQPTPPLPFQYLAPTSWSRTWIGGAHFRGQSVLLGSGRSGRLRLLLRCGSSKPAPEAPCPNRLLGTRGITAGVVLKPLNPPTPPRPPCPANAAGRGCCWSPRWWSDCCCSGIDCCWLGAAARASVVTPPEYSRPNPILEYGVRPVGCALMPTAG